MSAAHLALRRLATLQARFGGLTHEQIAKRTATPLGTVKSRIRSGLRALRATMETGAA